jgi:1,2-diacylglycerol 3-alpha-glucosyltransferase
VRVGLFCDMYTPHLSGVTHYIRLHKAELERLGHEVWVVTFGRNGADDAERNVIRCGGLKWGSTGWQLGLRFPREVDDLIATLDIAHLNHPVISGQLALSACRKIGVPTVFTNHSRYDMYSDVYARPLPQNVRYRAISSYLRKFLAEVSGVIAPTPSIARWLDEFTGFDRAHVIPGGIDARSFAAPSRPVTRRELGFEPDSVVYCYSGRLAHEKDPLALLEAFSRASAQSRDARLLLIGDGAARPNLTAFVASRRLEERVVFVGEQPHERIPDFLAAADVFVSTSASETQGLSLLECMAAGLPAACFSAPGMRDVVRDGVNGRLTAPQPGLLAEAMLEFADSRTRKRMSEAARKTATLYDARKTTPRLLEYYRSVGACEGPALVREALADTLVP